MSWHSDSLERQSYLLATVLLVLSTTFALLCSWFWPHWWVWILATALLIGLNRWQLRSRKRLLSAFQRASVQLDALQLQDYSLQAKPAYRTGIAATFQNQLQQLATQLQQRKSYFDEQQFLLYRLIDQLNTPILVLNHKQQLSYANSEFEQLFGHPWQSLRHTSAVSLGLAATPHWHFTDITRSRQWQIRHSRFLDQGERHQLLVFIDIQSALRENQLQAWQQLIRVLSHEIRNSLAPVQSLSEYLQTKLPAGREQDAVKLINERSQHLQDFVSRYAELDKELSITLQTVQTTQLFQSLQCMFPQAGLTLYGPQLSLLTDPVLLQQVLINLLKNALEAGSPAGTTELRFSLQPAYVVIELLDQGHGIHNPRDLFVPFYSTKPQGQGIGLALCRHIIERLGGTLDLQNRPDGICGVIARIRLPL